MKCSNCGNENLENNFFCVFCGSKLQISENGVQVNDTNQGKDERSKRITIIIMSVLGGLIIFGAMIFGGVYLYRQYKLKQIDKELQEQVGNIGTTERPGHQDENKEKYSVGKLVTLVDDSNWYVMSQYGNNVTLLSTENYGNETYFSNSENRYNKSIVKDIIENKFLPELKNSISLNNGNVHNLSARIVSLDDIRNILGVSSTVANNDIKIENSFRWLFETGSYWTSSESEVFNSVYVIQTWISFAVVSEDAAGSGLTGSGNKFNVRPVIETTIDNLK